MIGVEATTRVPLEGSAAYSISAVQFFLGAIIATLNILALAATAANRKLRNGPYLLMSNLWFANLILGVIISVANVGDRPDRATLQKAEGTISVINSLATLATFLAICTSRMVGSRTPQPRMAIRSVIKILVAVWSGIFLLVLIKTIVFTLHSMGPNRVCYPCLLGFEAALLLIFAIVTVLAYILVMYTTCVHLKTAVVDSGGSLGTERVDHAGEYRDTLTLGILLGVFTLPFICLIVTLLTHTIYRDLDEVATEAILTVFYLHCVFNPIVYMARDPEVKDAAKRILCCQRAAVTRPETEEDDRAFRPVTNTPPAAPTLSPSAPNLPSARSVNEQEEMQHPSLVMSPGDMVREDGNNNAKFPVPPPSPLPNDPADSKVPPHPPTFNLGQIEEEEALGRNQDDEEPEPSRAPRIPMF